LTAALTVESDLWRDRRRRALYGTVHATQTRLDRF